MLISDDGRDLAFNKRELALLTSMMAAPDARPNLAALWFHGGRAKAWATDGLRAVMVEQPAKPPNGTPVARPVAIPAITAHHLAKTASPRDLIVVGHSGTTITLDVREPKQPGTEITTFGQIDAATRSKHAVRCKRHEGGYDSIDFVFPSPHKRGSKGAVVAVDAGLLGPLLLLGKLVPAGEIWINVGPQLDPVLVAARAEGGEVWRIAIMPRRGSNGWPEIKPPPAEPKPAVGSTGDAATGDPPGETSAPAEPAKAPGRGRGRSRGNGRASEPAAASGGELAPPVEPTTAEPPATSCRRGPGRANVRAAS